MTYQPTAAIKSRPTRPACALALMKCSHGLVRLCSAKEVLLELHQGLLPTSAKSYSVRIALSRICPRTTPVSGVRCSTFGNQQTTGDQDARSHSRTRKEHEGSKLAGARCGLAPICQDSGSTPQIPIRSTSSRSPRRCVGRRVLSCALTHAQPSAARLPIAPFLRYAVIPMARSE